MAFRPISPSDRLLAAFLAILSLGLVLLLTYWLIQQPIGPTSVLIGLGILLLVAFAGLLLFRMWSLRTLDYWVQRDAIHILWRGEIAVIPMEHIRDIQPAQLQLRPAWLHWPQHWIFTQADPEIFAYATQPPERSLVILTHDETYLISPQDPSGFIAAFEERRSFGPARHLKPAIYLTSWRQHWLLHDRWAQGLLGGWLLLGIALLGYVAWHYPQLPDALGLHFNLQGEPDLISPRRAIFLLPGVAMLMGFLNAAIGFALYDYRRFFTYLLWSVSVLLQILAWYVTFALIRFALG